MRAFVVLLIIFTITQGLIGQDSLSKKTFLELDKLSVDAFRGGDLELSRVYSRYQIAMAKKQKDSVRVAFSFYTYMFDENLEFALKYCDSAIYYTKNSNHKSHPTYGYLVKGRRLLKARKFDEAMENLVIAYDYAIIKKNKNHISDAKQKIAAVKSFMGDYQGALKLFQEDYEYTVANDQTDFRKNNINVTIYNLAIIFIKNKMLDSARYYSKLGLQSSDIGTYRHDNFLGIYATVDYYSENYDNAFDTLIKYQSRYKGNILANKYYYIAKIYEKRNQIELANEYFLRVDSIVVADHEPFDEVKDVYQTLAQINKVRNNDSLQIVYINKYIWADSILNEQKAEINPLMTLKFDNPRMLAEKQRLIDKAEGKNKWIFFIGGLAFLLLLIGSALYLGQLKLKRKLEKLLEEGLKFKTQKQKVNSNIKLKVPQNIVLEIRRKLEEFERSKLVNNPSLSQNMLANAIDTNSSYLSNYINHFKGQNFPSYLKELRISLAVDRLKSEPHLLKYSIKGLALDFGFATPGAFSRAFVKHTGIKPSKFLAELSKKNSSSFINEHF